MSDAFKDYQQKPSAVIVYTGDGKGKTSASIGLACRGLGAGFKVAYIQFIKAWEVSEHKFFSDIAKLYGSRFLFHKGGAGFYEAGELSAKGVSKQQHQKIAQETFLKALSCVKSGDYDLVICDEINNATADKLLKELDLERLLQERHEKTSLCLTGRNFPENLISQVDIATNMTKVKHHFDNKFLANEGIDF